MSSCNWTTPAIGPPACSGTPRSVLGAAAVVVPAGGSLYVDACDEAGAQLSTTPAATSTGSCGASGTWAALAGDARAATSASVRVGRGKLWLLQAPLPFGPLPDVGRILPGAANVALCALANASAEQVYLGGVTLAPSLAFGSEVRGNATRSYSNDTADAVLAAQIYAADPNATVLFRAAGKQQAPPGDVWGFDATGANANAALFGFQLATGASASSAAADAARLAAWLGQAGAFCGLFSDVRLAPPGPPAASSLQSAQEAVSFWVPLASLSLFAVGTTLALSSYVANARKERIEKEHAANTTAANAASGARAAASVGARRVLRIS